MSEVKVCTKCNETKSVYEFYLHDKLKTERKTACKSCQSKRKKIIRSIPADLPGELWLPMVGFENNYAISDFGRLKKTKNRKNSTNQILKQSTTEKGYKFKMIKKDGVSTINYIHIAVAKAFIPNPDNLPEVNHKFGKKWDNRKTELEWSTSSDNMKHSYALGLQVSLKGENHNMSKLTEKEVLEIRTLKGVITHKELGEKYGVSRQTISKIMNNTLWKHI